MERLSQELKLQRNAKVFAEPASAKKTPSRKTWEYTEAVRAAIQARLLVGRAAALKKRESEGKTPNRIKTSRLERVKPVVYE